MKRFFIHGVLAISLLFPSLLFSQGDFNVRLDVKNMHYWRGLRVSDGFVTAPMVGYYNQGFAAFVWGGLSVDGRYREVSQIISYSSGGFSVTLLDIFNFSGLENADYFNFRAAETNHITDLSVAYTFGETLPLNILLATVIFGNDRDTNGDNRYSTYLEAGFPFVYDDYSVQPFLAFGFAPGGNDGNSLYGNNSFDVVNVGLRVNRPVTVGNHIMPVTGTLGFNPSLKTASVEIAISLF
jgi:hypothetical protein